VAEQLGTYSPRQRGELRATAMPCVGIPAPAPRQKELSFKLRSIEQQASAQHNQLNTTVSREALLKHGKFAMAL